MSRLSLGGEVITSVWLDISGERLIHLAHKDKPVYQIFFSTVTFLRFLVQNCLNINKKIVFQSFVGLRLVGSKIFSAAT